MENSSGARCCARGCTESAKWGLIPGFDNGREPYLCRRHMREARRRSPIEADCYAPVGREKDDRARLIPEHGT